MKNDRKLKSIGEVGQRIFAESPGNGRLYEHLLFVVQHILEVKFDYKFGVMDKATSLFVACKKVIPKDAVIPFGVMANTRISCMYNPSEFLNKTILIYADTIVKGRSVSKVIKGFHDIGVPYENMALYALAINEKLLEEKESVNHISYLNGEYWFHGVCDDKKEFKIKIHRITEDKKIIEPWFLPKSMLKGLAVKFLEFIHVSDTPYLNCQSAISFNFKKVGSFFYSEEIPKNCEDLTIDKFKLKLKNTLETLEVKTCAKYDIKAFSLMLESSDNGYTIGIVLFFNYNTEELLILPKIILPELSTEELEKTWDFLFKGTIIDLDFKCSNNTQEDVKMKNIYERKSLCFFHFFPLFLCVYFLAENEIEFTNRICVFGKEIITSATNDVEEEYNKLISVANKDSVYIINNNLKSLRYENRILSEKYLSIFNNFDKYEENEENPYRKLAELIHNEDVDAYKRIDPLPINEIKFFVKESGKKCSYSKLFESMEDGAMNTCLYYLKDNSIKHSITYGALAYKYISGQLPSYFFYAVNTVFDFGLKASADAEKVRRIIIEKLKDIFEKNLASEYNNLLIEYVLSSKEYDSYCDFSYNVLDNYESNYKNIDNAKFFLNFGDKFLELMDSTVECDFENTLENILSEIK